MHPSLTNSHTPSTNKHLQNDVYIIRWEKFFFRMGSRVQKVDKINPLSPLPVHLIQMERGIHPWYWMTHCIYPLMEPTDGIVSGIHPWYWSTHGIYPLMEPTHCIASGIHPWYSFTHGIVSEIHPWYSITHVIYPPIEFTYGIITKNTISNKLNFVKWRLSTTM